MTKPSKSDKKIFIPNANAYFQTMAKTPAKFPIDPSTSVGKGASRRCLLSKRSKFFPFRVDPFQKGGKTPILIDLPSLEVNP